MAKGKLTFEYAKCKGCELCVYVCPVKILELNMESVNIKGYNPVRCINIEKCIACGSCAIMCPDSVIKVESEE